MPHFSTAFVHRQTGWMKFFPTSTIAGKIESPEGVTWIIQVKSRPGTLVGVRFTKRYVAEVKVLTLPDGWDEPSEMVAAICRTLRYAGHSVVDEPAAARAYAWAA